MVVSAAGVSSCVLYSFGIQQASHSYDATTDCICCKVVVDPGAEVLGCDISDR